MSALSVCGLPNAYAATDLQNLAAIDLAKQFCACPAARDVMERV